MIKSKNEFIKNCLLKVKKDPHQELNGLSINKKRGSVERQRNKPTYLPKGIICSKEKWTHLILIKLATTQGNTLKLSTLCD